MNKIKVYEEDGKTIIEVPEGTSVEVRNQPKFKRGDFVYWSGINPHTGIILSHCDTYSDSWKVGSISNLSGFNVSCSEEYLRLATDAEKEEFIEELHKAGADWDGENIVDWKWIPKNGEEYWTINPFSDTCFFNFTFSGYDSEKNIIKNGLCFRTREEAEAALRRARG